MHACCAMSRRTENNPTSMRESTRRPGRPPKGRTGRRGGSRVPRPHWHRHHPRERARACSRPCEEPPRLERPSPGRRPPAGPAGRPRREAPPRRAAPRGSGSPPPPLCSRPPSPSRPISRLTPPARTPSAPSRPRPLVTQQAKRPKEKLVRATDVEGLRALAVVDDAALTERTSVVNQLRAWRRLAHAPEVRAVAAAAHSRPRRTRAARAPSPLPTSVRESTRRPGRPPKGRTGRRGGSRVPRPHWHRHHPRERARACSRPCEEPPRLERPSPGRRPPAGPAGRRPRGERPPAGADPRHLPSALARPHPPDQSLV